MKSLAERPKSFKDALKSPFWRRLLIAPDRKSSTVIIFMKGRHTEGPIQKLMQIVHELDAPDFRIHIAGSPYVVEMLRRSLDHDFRYFTLTAIALFGLTMAAFLGPLSRLLAHIRCIPRFCAGRFRTKPRSSKWNRRMRSGRAVLACCR